MLATLRKLFVGRWFALAFLFFLIAGADYRWLHLSERVDQFGGDFLLRLNARQRPVSDDVVIVDIDQRSQEQMMEEAGKWPWPRSIHGELIDHIEAQHPKAIIFDTLFDLRDSFRPEHDAMFADAVAQNPNVWLATLLNADGTGARVLDMPPSVGARPLTNPPSQAHVPLLLPLVVLPHLDAMRGGLINFTEDSDGVGRHHHIYEDRSGWRFASLAARAVESLGRRMPDQQSIMLNWRRGWHHVSYADVYHDGLREHMQRDPKEFSGKIVIVGTSAPGLQDLRRTPLDSTYPGVEILATAIDNLNRADWLKEVRRPATLPLAMLLLGFVAFAFRKGVSAANVGYVLLGVSVLVILAAWIMLRGGTFVPIFAPLAIAWAFYLACTGIAYLQERTERLRTSTMFKRFLDPRVVADLIDRGEIDYRAHAEAREITVLFSDIRGFTTLSETAPPEEVVTLLNRYFSRQVEVIFRHGGTLDKFIGDAIMAFWGAPTAYPDHAERAVTAAVEMCVALEELRSELGALGAEMDIGVGVHTGRAVVGCIGSTERLDYTAIGDTVNLASRIEGLTKGVARVLVSESTRTAVGEQFGWKDCGFHRVKGREMPVHLYEPDPKSGTPC